MAVFLSTQWTPTVSKLFTSLFFFGKLFYSLKVFPVISKYSFFKSETHSHAIVFQGPWLRALPLSG